MAVLARHMNLPPVFCRSSLEKRPLTLRSVSYPNFWRLETDLTSGMRAALALASPLYCSPLCLGPPSFLDFNYRRRNATTTGLTITQAIPRVSTGS